MPANQASAWRNRHPLNLVLDERKEIFWALAFRWPGSEVGIRLLQNSEALIHPTRTTGQGYAGYLLRIR
jgi:hypothetical protein